MYHRSLDTFLAVAETGSFLKAAKSLYLTPASVMNQMNRLEARVGVTLLLRSSQGTALTPAGEAFCEEVKGLVQASQQAVARARERAAAEQKQTTIRVATSLLRPCKLLMDVWEGNRHRDLPFHLSIVPFDESQSGMERMLSALGKDIDCFVSPCASRRWNEKYNILLIHMGRSCLAVPRSHRLASRQSLGWEDLEGESLLLTERGRSVVLDQIRDEIEARHPGVQIVDVPVFYGMDAFNLCEQRGCVMEIPDSWADIHPSLVTLPMDWDYQVAYGVIYAKKPSAAMAAFVRWLKPILAAQAALPEKGALFPDLPAWGDKGPR